MTSTLRNTPTTNGDITARRTASRTNSPARTPVRRRWGRIGAGFGVALVGAWIFAALYVSADDRADVLVMAENVDRLDVIERSDLRAVQLSENREIASIAASRIDEFVGRVAGVDLIEGSLIAPGQLLPADASVLAGDEAVVGLLMSPGDSPQGSLHRGVPILVVIRPTPGTGSTTEEIDGWVLEASGEAADARDRPVEVVVARTEASAVSAAAAEGRVSIVVLAG